MNTWMKHLPRPSRWVLLVSCLAVSALISTALMSVHTGAQAQNGAENRKKPGSASVAQPSTGSRPQVDVTINGVTPGCTEGIVDGGYETGGIPSTTWDPETSTNFGTPLCDIPSCGTGAGTAPPRTGDIWAWFGGIPAPETATIGQTVTIPVNSSATLTFWLRIGSVSAPFTDVLNVRVDGVIQQSFPEPALAEADYTLRTINLNAFANGAPHQILFEYIGPSTGTGNFTVDDVSLEICPLTPAPVIAAGPAAMVTESCPPANNAIDPDERVTVNLELHNNGSVATTNLVATLLTGGGVSSPSAPQSYGVLAPPGPGSSATRDFTFTASGTCGSSITATWELTDGATDLGTVTKTFVLGTSINSTTTIANAAPILIPATGTSGPAAPYPSTINVSGITDPVTKVTVTLKNMNHTFPDDIDVLLVGPGGQKLLLMSDAGGSADIVNNTYTFDDAAAATLSDVGPLASGTFKPSNFATGDTFPAPAPVGPYPDPQLLSVFNGVNPNGTWSLFVFDDVGGDVGNINLGWELNITTSLPVCTNPCGIVRLVTSSTLVRTSSSNVQATITVTNIGTLPAANVILTTGTLGGTPGTPLPQALGTINPGNSVNTVLNFATASSGPSTLATAGTYTGGTFSTTKRVTIPPSVPASK
jgi:subtilisin-like proprotein convertase family protein